MKIILEIFQGIWNCGGLESCASFHGIFDRTNYIPNFAINFNSKIKADKEIYNHEIYDLCSSNIQRKK